VTPAEPDEIVREVDIAATPADVFPYFVDAQKLRAWKAVAAEADARPGGRFRMDITGQGVVAIGSYLVIEPPHRVVFTWEWEGDDQPGRKPGVVEVTFSPSAQGTRLRLVHRGVDSQRRAGSAKGWTHYLERLALVAGGRDAGPDPWAASASMELSQRRQP
jgi:uncharacterized protein YndB with AHSA1/START domain